MQKVITIDQAYVWYIEEKFDDIMPFSSTTEPDFIDYLYDRGIMVADECE